MRTKFCPRCGSHDVERRIIVGQTAKERRTCRSCGYFWEYQSFTQKTEKTKNAQQQSLEKKKAFWEHWKWWIALAILVANIVAFVVSVVVQSLVPILLWGISGMIEIGYLIVLFFCWIFKKLNLKQARMFSNDLPKAEKERYSKMLLAWLMYGIFMVSVLVALVGMKASLGWGILYVIVGIIAAFGILVSFVPKNTLDDARNDRSQTVGENNTENSYDPRFYDTMSGMEYEKFVCYRLSRLGFRDIQMTKASDDNGADILAVTPDGHTIAIQCKKYNDHVGKHAVQEALSARDYYYRSQAAVITNSVFTRQAKEFAKRTGVILVENFK